MLSKTSIPDFISQAKQSESTCGLYLNKCPYSIDSANHSPTENAENYLEQEENK